MADNINPLEGTEVPPQLKKLAGNIRSIGIILVLLVAAFLSFYTVDPEEVGVVQRFGEYQRTAEPGLNFKFPFMESVRIVPVERQLKQEFGYRTVQSGVQTQYQKAGYENESLMLTGDLNL
ncbi:MAG: FtsH protease activity modulator HflK, partial [Bacteroidetes bacterium]|nr:FtsH protease activity modulator HflK [Bacteroidota bacterium]